MTARKLGALSALVILLVIACNASAAQKVDSKARNIYQLFTKTNPKLEAGTVKKYVDIVIAAAQKYKQDAYVIAAIIVHESTVNAKAVSKGGDYGLMQVRWRVHEKAIKAEYPKIRKAIDFLDARTNIFFGTRILSECAAKSKDLNGTLMRYSGGGTKITAKVMNTVKELQAKDTAQKTKPKKRSFLDRLFNRNKS
mgnify:CR=1 FL=1